MSFKDITFLQTNNFFITSISNLTPNCKFKMESKTIKYLKNIAGSSFCKTNPIIRLHYRSAFDSIATNPSESSITKSLSDLECRHCYSKSPTLKVTSRGSRAKKPRTQIKKQVNMLCRVCKNKYTKDNATELNSRKKDVGELGSSGVQDWVHKNKSIINK